MISLLLPLVINTEHGRQSTIRLLPQWKVDSVPLYLVYYRNRGAVPTVRSMVAFLQERFTATHTG